MLKFLIRMLSNLEERRSARMLLKHGLPESFKKKRANELAWQIAYEAEQTIQKTSINIFEADKKRRVVWDLIEQHQKAFLHEVIDFIMVHEKLKAIHKENPVRTMRDIADSKEQHETLLKREVMNFLMRN